MLTIPLNSPRSPSLSNERREAKGSINDVWKDFVAKLPPEQLEALARNGLNPDDINDECLTRFHRLVEPEDASDTSSSGSTYWTFIMGNHQRKVDAVRKKPEDLLADFATAIAARVVDAFDCSRDPRVRFHADCMRIALGYTDHGSLDKIAKRYDTDKQKVHWHVKTIRKRIGL